MESQDKTQAPERSQPRGPGRFSLLILGGGVPQSVELPAEGTLTIGRDPTVEIRLDDATASRRHARISIRDGELLLTDLGSHNGTAVRGQPIRGEHRLALGDVIEIGNTCLLVRSAGPDKPSGARAFEGAVEAACSGGERGEHFGVILVRASVGSPALQDVVRSVLRPTDTMYELGPGEIGALCTVNGRRGVDTVAERLRSALSERGWTSAVGTAAYPFDGVRPVQLMGLARSALRESASEARPAVQAPPPIVRSPAMAKVYATLDSVAQSSLSVLITGETGTGKQVLAEAIHARSERRARPFVRINCAALPEPLLEAELFGYEKGAFTGAYKQKVGLIEHAAGGTFMLDEIGDMPMSLQAKLLQVLEEKRTRPVGALESRPVDVRVVAATHQDLPQRVKQGLFRADLYWRLSGVLVAIPPLRDRREEILPLAESFLTALARETSRPCPRLSADAAKLLLEAPWPGNVRQLRNLMERALLMAPGDEIQVEPLAQWLETPLVQSEEVVPTSPPASAARPGASPAALRDELNAVERERIREALEKTGNNQTRAAALLGIPRRTLIDRIERYGLPRPRKPQA